jgi:hypothetical protein
VVPARRRRHAGRAGRGGYGVWGIGRDVGEEGLAPVKTSVDKLLSMPIEHVGHVVPLARAEVSSDAVVIHVIVDVP